MDNLAALNVVPFLGLMSLVEVKYLHMPEVYRTILAILCDYNPLSRENVVKTRNYISVLLAREPDLAECLLNFIDMPEEKSQTLSLSSVAGRPVKGDEKNSAKDQAHSMPTEKLKHFKGNKSVPATRVQEVRESTQPCYTQEGGDWGLVWTDKSDCDKDQSLGPFTSAGANVPLATIKENAQTTESSPALELDEKHFPLTQEKPTSVAKMPQFAPVINIHHKNTLSLDSEFTTVKFPGSSASVPPSPSSHETSSGCEHAADLCFVAKNTSPTNEQISITSWNCLTSGWQLRSDSITPDSLCIESNKLCQENQTQTSASALAPTKETSTGKEMQDPTKDISNVSSPLRLETKPWPVHVTCASQTKASSRNPSACLSKLLGQPSVAYLPAGHFTDDRNCIVGSYKLPAAEKLTQGSILTSGKLPSAAAKLHLLSTQAGNEKNILFQAGRQTATAAFTTTVQPLSVQTPQLSRTKKMVKFSSQPQGRSKMITLSKSDMVIHPEETCIKLQTTSSDKQIQVGQHQISKKSKTPLGRRDQTSHMHPPSKVNAKQQSLNRQSSKASLLDEENHENNEKDIQVLQQVDKTLDKAACTDEGSHAKQKKIQMPENQKINMKPKNTEMLKQKTEVSPDSKKKHDTLVSTQKRQKKCEQPAVSQCEMKKRLAEHLHMFQSRATSGPHPKSSLHKMVHYTASESGTLQSEQMMTNKSSVSRQRVQVVEVSMGTTPRLSAFPYIQKLILPDGQVSTIAHNSAELGTLTGSCDTTKTADTDYKHPLTASTHAVSQQSACNSPSAKDGERKAQIVLPKNQVKLSVSIQTQSSKLNMTSVEKGKHSSCHPSKHHSLAMYSHSSSSSGDTRELQNLKTQVSTFQKSASADENAPAPILDQCYGKGKRKRPHTSGSSLSKPVATKNCKLQI